MKDKDDDTRVLEFKHPLFQRDHPELMSDIKRSCHASEDTPSGEDFQTLKAQVLDLTAKVNFLYRLVSNVAFSDLSSLTDDSTERPSKWQRGGEVDDMLDTLIQLESNGTGGGSCEGDINRSIAALGTIERREEGYTLRGAPYSHDFLKHRNFLISSGANSVQDRCGSEATTSCDSQDPPKPAIQHPFSHAVAAFGTICSNFVGER